jgi:hypothetical protein
MIARATVWLHNPGNQNPFGGLADAPRAVIGMPGEWDAYGSTGGPGGLPIVTYVATEPMDGLAFDMNAFIDDAVGTGILDANLYLSLIFAGFEIWSGESGAQVTKFCARVE